jgi:hypothetical protein
MRYLATVNEPTRNALVDAIEDLAAHLAAHGEMRLAAVVTGALDGDESRLPQRFLGLFTRGMGGLLDVPLCTNGDVDRAATERRDQLADLAHREARAALSS